MKETTYKCELCGVRGLNIDKVKGIVIHDTQSISLSYEKEDIENCDKHICSCCMSDICRDAKEMYKIKEGRANR